MYSTQWPFLGPVCLGNHFTPGHPFDHKQSLDDLDILWLSKYVGLKLLATKMESCSFSPKYIFL